MSYEPEYPEPREPGPRASFTVQVDSFDTSGFYEDVVRAATDHMMSSSWSPSQLQKDIQKLVQAKVDERLNAVVDEAVSALLAKPIQKFDTFGNAVGTPLSVEEIVRNGATVFLTETVDSSGKPSRDSYGTKHTRLEWLVQNNVVNGLNKELAEEAKKVRAEIVARASAAAATVLAGVKP